MLELARPRPTWQGAAHDGTLVLPDGSETSVVAVLGPENAAADALGRARRSAEVALTLRHPGVLRLLQVAAYEGRVAWCYEDFDGLGLGHVVGRDGTGDLSARAAAELVAQAAEVLLALGQPGLRHPGPEPSDVVLGADGHCRIAGFAGPYPVAPAMRAPSPGDVEPAAVYRLGVLLATLISGVPPAPTSDAAAHSVAVRRALIGAMERSGPVISERYGMWIRGMLAWAPAERPPLSAVPSGLRAVAWAMGGEGLLDWAGRRVPEIQAAVVKRHTAPPADSIFDDLDVRVADEVSLVEVVETGPPPARPRPPDETTLPPVLPDTPVAALPPVDPVASLPPPFPNDEPTQEATHSPEQATPGPQPPRKRRGSPDSIPVDIGPPVEALAGKKPTLPPGFLDKTDPQPSGGPTVQVERSQPTSQVGRPAMVAIIVALSAVGVLLLTYLLYGGGQTPQRTPSDGPGLDAAVEAPVVDDPTPTDFFDVPAPDLVERDTDAMDTDWDDTDWYSDEADDTDDTDDTENADEFATQVAVTPPVGAPRPKRREGTTILVRLAGTQRGRISASCEGDINGSGDGEVRLWGLRDGATCTIWSRGPGGTRVTDTVVVAGPATVDCFRDWASDCLD